VRVVVVVVVVVRLSLDQSWCDDAENEIVVV
jgi:hypothetical protein